MLFELNIKVFIGRKLLIQSEGISVKGDICLLFLYFNYVLLRKLIKYCFLHPRMQKI